MIFSLLLACAHSVDITLTGARIAPQMASNTPWDGPEKLNPEAKGLLDSVLSSVDSSGKLAEMVGGAATEIARPDVAATLEFRSDAEAAPYSVQVPEVPNNLEPTWGPGLLTIKNAAITGKSTLSIILVDKDMSSDDPIGKVVLTTSQICKAEAMDGAMTVNVADQTSGQIESVSVLVVRSGK
ncbi:hypothetical protein LBMAG42_01080 [Deltaproteobacteria bacterium]|nr:hypothetical protein LBMAG42_01080 [Deltaproteobacteria bacterium]